MLQPVCLEVRPLRPYWRAEGIVTVRVKLLVCPHDCNQVLGIGQIDDVVCVAGEDMNGFDLVAADFKFEQLVTADTALLNESVSRHDNEKFPF